MAPRRLLVLLVLIFSTALLGFGGMAHADADGAGKQSEPGRHGDAAEHGDWAGIGHFSPSSDAFARKMLAQARREPRTCSELDALFDDIVLLLSDADLAGGNGSIVCVMAYLEADTLMVVLLNQRSIDEWRRTKARFLPMLTERGISLCSVASWGSLNASIVRAQTYNDRQSQERHCEPVFITHGPESENRLEQVKNAVALASATAEELFDWRPTFAINVHVYDRHIDFVQGVWVDGGNDTATPRSLEDVGGVAMILANGQSGFLLDISNFEDETGLQMLVAHEFGHIVQNSLMGCTCTMPFWAVEGGAEYFASRVVGADERHLVQRFRAAVNDQFAKSPPALKKINVKPRDPKLELAAYSRGYAAFRYMAVVHGDDAYSRMHRDRPTGSIDRYLATLTHITGLTLDDFDTNLAGWLKESANSLPVRESPPNTTLQPNSQVTYLASARIVGRNTFDEVAGYSSRDQGAVIVSEWRCAGKAIRAELTVFTPSNQRFARVTFTVPPGCGELVLTPFSFDTAVGGRTARSQPGTWRVEITGDGALQAGTTFTLN